MSKLQERILTGLDVLGFYTFLFLSLCIQSLIITIPCRSPKNVRPNYWDQAFHRLNDVKLPPSRASTSWRQFSMALCERLTASRINSIVKCRGRSTQKRQKGNWEVVAGSERIIDRATRLLYPLRPEADGTLFDLSCARHRHTQYLHFHYDTGHFYHCESADLDSHSSFFYFRCARFIIRHRDQGLIGDRRDREREKYLFFFQGFCR